jgi:predicted O-methyltransferase YrrM
MTKSLILPMLSLLLLCAGLAVSSSGEQKTAETAVSDARVRQMLDSHRGSWGGMNVPEADGKALYDIILKNGYKNALEIGTSNGYSGMWIAWALSKTGGKLITVEIDRNRHEEAQTYFREAGLAKYIDARLGDAHDIVPALPGPFDFVFCDADKEWYENYLKAVLPKLTVGGCFAAHNVFDYSGWGGGRARGSRRGFGGGMSGGYLEFARSLPNLETSVLSIPGSGGLAVSYKKSK